MTRTLQPLLVLAQTAGQALAVLPGAGGFGRGYYLSHGPDGEEKDWSSAGFMPAPRNEAAAAEHAEFLRDTLALADALALANGRNPLWWATIIASRNRFASPLLPLLNAYAAALDAMQAALRDGRDLALVGLPGPVLRQVREIAPGLGFTVLSAHSGLTALGERLGGEYSAWRDLASGFGECLQRIRAVARSRMASEPGLPAGPVYLIKSFAYHASFDAQGEFHDPFYGLLAAYLTEALGPEATVLTVCVGFGEEQECALRMRAVPGAQVLPLEDFLRPSDTVLGFLRVALNRLLRPLRAPTGTRFLGQSADALLAECLKSGGWRVNLLHALHRPAGRRLAKSLRLACCLTTFEGNPWERMFLLGLREESPGLFCLGYQHAVVPPAATGVFVTPAEVDFCPLPDRILSTGEVPAGLIRVHGALPQERLQVACALRQDMKVAVSAPPGFHTVLVAMEGVREVLPLMRYALDEAWHCPETRFLVRSHPVLPLSRLLAEIGCPTLPPNVCASQGAPLLDDIAACHAVLYWGTTVALEALALGRPVIHFDNGLRPSFDPLHGFVAFKWTTAAGQPLAETLRAISSLAASEFERRAQAGREHVLNYFHPPTPQALAAFLPPASPAGGVPEKTREHPA